MTLVRVANAQTKVLEVEGERGAGAQVQAPETETEGRADAQTQALEIMTLPSLAISSSVVMRDIDGLSGSVLADLVSFSG